MIDVRHMKKLFLWMLLTAGCMTAMAQQRVKISGQSAMGQVPDSSGDRPVIFI